MALRSFGLNILVMPSCALLCEYEVRMRSCVDKFCEAGSSYISDPLLLLLLSLLFNERLLFKHWCDAIACVVEEQVDLFYGSLLLRGFIALGLFSSRPILPLFCGRIIL